MEKAMATHSSTLAWKIPWMEEPGRLQSMGSLRVRQDWATSLSFFTFHFHALEKEMATHSSVPAWRIPGMAEPGGLPSMGSHRVGHDWSDLAAAAAASMFTLLWNRFPELFQLVNLKPYTHLTKLSPFALLTSPWYPMKLLHICEIIQYLSFCDWFISFSITSSTFTHVVACDKISF